MELVGEGFVSAEAAHLPFKTTHNTLEWVHIKGINVLNGANKQVINLSLLFVLQNLNVMRTVYKLHAIAWDNNHKTWL